MIATSCAALLFSLALTTGAAAPAPAFRAQNKPPVDLTGTWVLNRELSDKPGQGGGGSDPGGRRGRSGGGGGGMGGFGGGMGRRGGGGGGAGMPDREEMERRRAALDAILHVSNRLIIVKGDSGLVVTDEDGVSTRLALDGKKETGALNGVPFETTTKWENDALRVAKKFKGGLEVVETYAVSSDPRMLTLTLKLERGGNERTMRRVYDLHEPS